MKLQGLHNVISEILVGNQSDEILWNILKNI